MHLPFASVWSRSAPGPIGCGPESGKIISVKIYSPHFFSKFDKIVRSLVLLKLRRAVDYFIPVCWLVTVQALLQANRTDGVFSAWVPE